MKVATAKRTRGTKRKEKKRQRNRNASLFSESLRCPSPSSLLQLGRPIIETVPPTRRKGEKQRRRRTGSAKSVACLITALHERYDAPWPRMKTRGCARLRVLYTRARPAAIVHRTVPRIIFSQLAARTTRIRSNCYPARRNPVRLSCRDIHTCIYYVYSTGGDAQRIACLTA